jgi:hypothetical protein
MSLFNPDEFNQTRVSPNQRLSSNQGLAVLALHDIMNTAGKPTTYQDILDMADIGSRLFW